MKGYLKSGLMKSVLVWLAVMTTTFHTSQASCWDSGTFHDDGAIIVRGMNNTNLTAGYIEICIERDLWALCSDGWDSADAIQLCLKFGFLQMDLQTQHCGNSCLGRSERAGITGFWINDTDYGWSSENVTCGQNAGIVCNKLGSTGAPLNSTTPHQTSTYPSDQTTTNTESTTGTATNSGGCPTQSSPSLAALGGGLGGLCAVLATLLVGVVIGWVWYCTKQREKHLGQGSPTTRSVSDNPTLQNPTYNHTHPNLTPPVQYSSLGPRRTASSSHPPPLAAAYDVVDLTSAPSQTQGGEKRVYHVLERPQEKGERRGGVGGEGEYQLLGEVEGGNSKVPISTTPPPAQPATQQVPKTMDTGYSSLKHQ